MDVALELARNPLPGRRLGAGAGGGPVVLTPCDTFQMSVMLDKAYAGWTLAQLGLPDDLLQNAFVSPPSPPDQSGMVTVSWSGVFPTNSKPRQVFPLTFFGGGTPIVVTSAQVTGKSAQGPCKPAFQGPPLPWGGGGAIWGGGGGGAIKGASPFTLQQYHRIRSTTVAAGGGALPPDFQNVTGPSLQKQLDQAGVQSRVVSVVSTSTSLVVVEDHCGPTATTSTPFVVTDGGITVSTTYEDLGLGTSCPAAPKKKIWPWVAGGAVAVAVVAGASYWAWGR